MNRAVVDAQRIRRFPPMRVALVVIAAQAAALVWQASRYVDDRDLVLVGYRGVDGSVRLDCPVA
jgi:hypothetical protein